MDTKIVNYQNYYPIGDIIVVALSAMILFLIVETFINKNKRFRIFQALAAMLCSAALCSLGYHQLVNHKPAEYVDQILLLYDLYHMLLYFIMYFFIYYVIEMLSLSGKTRRRIFLFIGPVTVCFTLLQFLSTFLKFGFHWSAEKGGFVEAFHLFIPAYAFYIGVVIYLLIRYHERMVPQIVRGLVTVFSICVILLLIAGRHGQTSFTTFTFIMPILTMLYLLHSNPYDVSTGAMNEAAFHVVIKEAYEKKQKLFFLCLQMHNPSVYENVSSEVRMEIFHFFTGVVKKSVLCKLENGNLVLVFSEKYNPDPEKCIRRLCEEFDKLYEKFHAEYRVIIMESEESLSRDDSYKKFFRFLMKRIVPNTYHHVNAKDLEAFYTRQTILAELEDISEKRDLFDERVLVYCQPVFNVKNGCYDTAEALMRLNLLKLGTVPPGAFIDLAEEYDLIHPLSMIILNKTCYLIRRFLDEGYKLHRISVNFSIQEVHDPDFCKDIIEVVKKHGIPFEKIAIELTESRNESEFELVKNHINELKEFGMKFYLDDFGTGYSNFERIMELPFDIIKFDRSLVIEAGKDQNSAYMVETFANMFRRLEYRVLYEGVETEDDEKRCIDMCAQYLQGFKYSKPIRIEELSGFLSHA